MDPVSYTLRDVDGDLWRRLKVRAAVDGVSIRAQLIDLITKHVSEEGTHGKSSDTRAAE